MHTKRPFKNRKGMGAGFFLLIAAILLTPVGLAAFAGYYLFLKDAEKPLVNLLPETQVTSLRRPFTLTAHDEQSGIRSLIVTVTQGQRRFNVVHKIYTKPLPQVTLRFTLAGSELRGGAFELQASAADGSYANLGNGNTARITRKMVLDTSFPSIKPLTPTHYVRQGGVGLVIYEVSKDVAKSGVQVGHRFYPGFKQDTGQYACLFAFPCTMPPQDFRPRLVVEDRAGNEKTGFFVNMAIKRRFRDERVDITDAFLATKLPAFASLFPEINDPVVRFQKINRLLRRQNQATLTDLAAQTVTQPLWDGPFLYLPHSVVVGSFGADRTYLYNGREIDHERHLGIDLASTPNAPVPAANNGVVVLAGPLGIYGQTVVIDHGLGLQTLYGHLSSLAVSAGDTVKKGDIIGNTGTSGLATSNNVHFAMLLDGQPVIPIEWWDGHWLEDNVTQKLKRYLAPAS